MIQKSIDDEFSKSKISCSQKMLSFVSHNFFFVWRDQIYDFFIVNDFESYKNASKMSLMNSIFDLKICSVFFFHKKFMICSRLTMNCCITLTHQRMTFDWSTLNSKKTTQSLFWNAIEEWIICKWWNQSRMKKIIQNIRSDCENVKLSNKLMTNNR